MEASSLTRLKLAAAIVVFPFFFVGCVDGNNVAFSSDKQESQTNNLIVDSLEHRFVTEQDLEYKTTYVGFERGSRRVVRNLSLASPGDDYVLGFSVKFCEGFDFARGGKLHGLGPKQPVAGGNSVEPERWSARLMWRGDGTLQSYVYHQDMKAKYGDTSRATMVKLEPNQYYEIAMRIKLNEPVGSANGFVQVFVDGEQIINHQGLRFRGVESGDALIQTFMFNTFHGGNNSDWAPRDETGNFKIDCAYFKNIQVTTFDR